ncbi:YciI family protein [Amnibacterium sp.]|uniref:YciI family protein n=1 Tax=Amnibacterium sp. TaxID=1872496 RepID=UPI003F7BCEA6
MTKYLISFPSEAMVVDDDELPAVADASHAVIAEAKAAGVYVFAGGIAEEVPTVQVAADGSTADAPSRGSELTGGFTVLELPSRDDAIGWARRMAAACRCPQELREFMFDPAS